MNEIMKVEFQKLVTAMREEANIDLAETPALFRWSYPEEPYLVYELMIAEVDPSEVEGTDIIQTDEVIH